MITVLDIVETPKRTELLWSAVKLGESVPYARDRYVTLSNSDYVQIKSNLCTIVRPSLLSNELLPSINNPASNGYHRSQ